MMLSNLIRRGGKHKGSKVNESRGCQQLPSPSTAEPSLVLDIKEESLSPSAAQSSPLVELNLFDSNEDWFPQELLQSGSSSTESPSSRTPNNIVIQSDSGWQETRTDQLPEESVSKNASNNVASRGKSIPAPILIPGAGLLLPNVKIRYSAVSAGTSPPEIPQLNANVVALKPPSPSGSEDLSSISGTTLARALITSTFVLSSNERRSLRRRGETVRQDSATLPRGDGPFLSNPGRSSSIPPVLSVNEKAVRAPLNHSSVANSGAANPKSDYPMSDSYVTPPETGSVEPQQILQQTPLPTTFASAETSHSASLDTLPQWKADPVPTYTQVVKNDIVDGPKTAVEVPFLATSKETTLQQERPSFLRLEDHILDEFDFVPPEHLVAFPSPGSDSSAPHVAPLHKRNGTIRGQRKRRIGGSNLAKSEHDYGELLNSDLTVGPGSGSSLPSSSTASAGYQTFPETPMIFSPFGSPGYAFLAKSDSPLRKYPRSPKYVRPGIVKPYSGVRIVKQQVDNINGVGSAVALRRSQSSSPPGQQTLSPKTLSPKLLAKSSLSPLPQENHEVGNPEQSIQSSKKTWHARSQSSLELQATVRLHPLAHVSPSSSYQHNRKVSESSVASKIAGPRERARPPLPIGPRRPIGPGHVFDDFIPGSHDRSGSISSVRRSPTDRPKSVWRKLRSAASKPPPKFQTPPPKWRGLTLEAAHWTFTSAQLQQIVSQAIQQSSEGSSLRVLRLETLEGEITDEVHRLELQHTDVKAQYKVLARKRWMLMGALAGCMEGGINGTATASCAMQELAEVLLALDHLAEKAHEIALRLAQLNSLRDVHNASALAMVVRKINGLFVRQMAEKERLVEQVKALQTERDEAWKQAENIAQDYDKLNERVEEAKARTDSIGVNTTPLVDTLPSGSRRRSTRISAVRKSSVHMSQAGLRSRSKLRPPLRPASLTLEDIPPVPNLRLTASPAVETGVSLGSVYSPNARSSEAWELAEAQREVYGMLGLSVPPSQASWRHRTLSDPDDSRLTPLSSRPASDSFDTTRTGSREDRGRATKSVVLDNRLHSVSQLGRIAST